MLQEYKDKKLFEEFIYSSAVDILLSWGRNHMLAPEDAAVLQRMEDQWEALCQEEVVPETLEAGLTALAENTDEALNFFDLHPYIALDSQSASEVATAAEILDHVVFLAEAADAFPRRSAFPAEFCKGVKQLLETVTIDKAPSTPRLIPINLWRSEMAAHIPEEHRYLFPWYVQWNDIPPETIALLIDHWKAIASESFDGLAIDPNILEALLVEMSADPDLLSYIRRQARMEELIPKAIEASMALRLYITSEKEAANYAVPSEVEAKGLGACALRLIENKLKKRATEADNLETMFMAAFCAPFLSDQTRITLFSRIEDDLQSMDHASFAAGGILAKLAEWAGTRLSGKDLAAAIFNRWMDDLANIASVATFAPDDVAKVQIETVVSSMLEWRPSIKTQIPAAATKLGGFLDRITSAASGVVNMRMRSPSPQALSETDDIQETGQVAFKAETGNIIDLPMAYDRKGKLRIPGKDPDNPILENLRENLLKKAVIYWNAVYKIAGEPEEKTLFKAPKLHNDGRPKLATLDRAPYEYVVVCISPRAETIQKTMAGQELADEEKKQIVFLRYQDFENKS